MTRCIALDVGLDLDPQDLGPLAAIDRQHAMRRDFGQRFAEIEEVAESLAVALALLFLLIRGRWLQLRRFGARLGLCAGRSRFRHFIL